MDRIERLKEFLAASPADSFLQHALALEYVKLGDDSKAEELFRQVVTHDENYIGTYYHLAKLLERTGQVPQAILVYEVGMQKAKQGGDGHAYNELQAAYEDLVY